jgi:hypothetical protein
LSRAPSLARLLLYAAAIAAALRLAVFLCVALGRLTFPWEVEFLEGLTIDYAWTLLHGGNIYAPPSAHFAPNWYPPLHYLLSLPALWLGDWSLAAARSVSIASILLALVAGGLRLRRLGASWAGVFLFVAALLSFYPRSDYWYDVARVDASATLLAFLGVLALADPSPGRRRVFAAGVLLALSVFAKQTNVAVAAGAVLALALERDRARLRQLLAAMLATALPLGVLLLAAFGRDALIIVTQPRGHYFALRWIRVFVLFAWPLPLLAAAAFYGRRLAGEGATRAVLGRVLVVAAPAFLMGLVTMCKLGGQLNSSMPTIFLLAFALGLATDALVADARGRAVFLAATLLVAALPPWDYLDWIPSAGDRREADEILADMRAEPGPFLAYNASFVSTQMRGDMYPYWDRLYDWAGGQNKATPFAPDPARYPQDFLRLIRERRFSAVYTNASDYLRDPVYQAIGESYVATRVWAAGLGPHVRDVRWRHCVPRLKWLPRQP